MSLLAVALVSGAALTAQVGLTRVLAIAQGYHFAFLVISLALLGFGASGTLLAVAPRLGQPRMWPWYASAYGAATGGAFLFLDAFPFDPYLVARDTTELLLLFVDLIALALPFLFAGLLIGAMLSRTTERAGAVYGANLLGSGLGALAAPALLDQFGSERTVFLAGLLGSVAAFGLIDRRTRTDVARPPGRAVTVAACLIVVGVLAGAVAAGFELHPSPHRRLAQLRLDPEVRFLATRQDARSRLDIVTSPAIHSAPGLSLSYTGPLPVQAGLVVDANDLLPVPAASGASDALARSLPVSVAHRLRPGGRVLLLGSGGGTDAWAALRNGASEVTIVEPDALIFDALRIDLRSWAGLADDPRAHLVKEPIRSFVERDPQTYDVVELTLTDAYRPVSSGALSLTEDYRLTSESFRAYLGRLSPEGLLVVTRWAQTSPTESLRTLALIVDALEARGVPDPRAHLLAFRSFQTVTFLASQQPLAPADKAAFFEAIEELRYDLVLAPEVRSDLVNRWAEVPSPDDHERALELVGTRDRSSFYAGYPFDVAPPTDDRPFFFHFFRLEQTSALVEELGRRWQPFGGGGYFILVALLGFAVVVAGTAVVMPLLARRRFRAAFSGRRELAARTIAYVVALGLAFLFVEVTLVQRAILVLGDPTHAFATVVGTLLVASGVGSALSARLPWQPSMLALVALLGLHAALSWVVGPALLALPDPLPLAVVVAVIAPVGFLMGVPFPRLVKAIGPSPELVAWAWAANGSASVVSGILATIIALSFGFGVVLAVAAALYLLAAVLVPRRSMGPATAVAA